MKMILLPIITDSRIELLGFYPENEEHVTLLRLIKEAFCLSEDEIGYEIKVREILSKIWLMLFESFYEQPSEGSVKNDKNDVTCYSY